VRIGLIIYGSLDTVSGGYLYDRMLVEYLRRQGEQVEIISLPWRTYGRHLSHNFSRSLFQRLRQARLDVLLQDELNHPSLVWLNRRLRDRVRYPILSIVHHLRCSEARPAWQNGFYRWIEQRYLASVDGFIFNSQTTRTIVEKLAGTNRMAVVAHPGGDRLHPNLTPDQITARVRQPGPLRLLFVGNLISRKGLHTLLAGLARLPRNSWQLDVVGSLEVDSTYVRSIRRQITRQVAEARQMAATGLTEQVTLSGSISDADLATRLAQSHLLAVPSSYEGFGIIYLEGMGFGLPAIASTAGAASEIITHGQDGFLAPPNDPATLAQHIHELSRNRERLLQLSLAARQRYARHPTWNDSMGQIWQFLRSWVNQK
jgi:glycosyltransferase involved in cell wall biosynthesis